MSSSAFNYHLPIEYISFDNTVALAFMFLGFIQVSLYIILDWDSKIYSFFCGSKCSSIQKEQPIQPKSSEVKEQEKKHDEESIRKGDVEVVFRSLGMLSHPPREQEDTLSLDCNDIFDLFEEKEATEDEVRAAFEVFDENKDGFIDARELQRVLLALGLREGSDLENCCRMIKAVDENGDNKIDFDEFIKFMDTILC